MQKIKIVHVQLLPLLSGVQNMMMSLLASLDRQKYEIYVISKPADPAVKEEKLAEKVREAGFIHLPVKSLRRNLSPWDIIALFALYRLFHRYKFDIVHTHSSKPGFLGRIAARMAGVKKIIHTAHGFPFHQHQPAIARIFYRELERFAAFFCDKIVVVNNFEREEAIRNKIIAAHKLVTIYNGIKVSGDRVPRLYPKQVQSPQTKQKNATDGCSSAELSDYFVIGLVARFSAAKNIVNLTKIALNVVQKSDNILFLFIGDGELFDVCKSLVTAQGETKRVLMPGWQSNIKEWLDKMDVFLLYSLWEGLSVSILEAMASGLPIIASDIKGNNELVREENGILVDVKNHQRLEEVLLSLPGRSAELTGWSSNSLHRAKEQFGYEQFVKAYREIYETES